MYETILAHESSSSSFGWSFFFLVEDAGYGFGKSLLVVGVGGGGGGAKRILSFVVATLSFSHCFHVGNVLEIHSFHLFGSSGLALVNREQSAQSWQREVILQY